MTEIDVYLVLKDNTDKNQYNMFEWTLNMHKDLWVKMASTQHEELIGLLNSCLIKNSVDQVRLLYKTFLIYSDYRISICREALKHDSIELLNIVKADLNYTQRIQLSSLISSVAQYLMYTKGRDLPRGDCYKLIESLIIYR